VLQRESSLQAIEGISEEGVVREKLEELFGLLFRLSGQNRSPLPPAMIKRKSIDTSLINGLHGGGKTQTVRRIRWAA
jgi:hypothetical protein